MKKYVILISIILISCTLQSQAQSKKAIVADDILTAEQMPDAAKFLPDPPEINSPKFFVDFTEYQKGKEIRDTERGIQAVEDANLSLQHFLDRFSAAMDCNLSEEATPAIAKYVITTYINARKSIQTAKNKFHRVRPYNQFHEGTPVPEDEGPTDDTSYPSGHSIRAWATALALVGVDPEHQEEILKVGYEMCKSRVIIGFHYQSDIEAAIACASAAYARLSVEPQYQKLQKAAIKELQNIK